MENKIHLGDCLEVMKNIKDGSIDMILTDLPYGTTAGKWDCLISLEDLWNQFKRILTFNGAVVLTATQPFASKLICSNLEWFKYELIWQKNRPTGAVHAKNKPLRYHENILVFSPGTTVHKSQSQKRMTYNPQMEVGIPYIKKQKSVNSGSLNHSPSKSNQDYVGKVCINEGTRYPSSILNFSIHNVGLIHPTQKPVKLFEYLIKTYTNEGDLVLDATAGSGTTAIACVNTNRRFICIEKDEEFYKKSVERLKERMNNE